MIYYQVQFQNLHLGWEDYNGLSTDKSSIYTKWLDSGYCLAGRMVKLQEDRSGKLYLREVLEYQDAKI